MRTRRTPCQRRLLNGLTQLFQRSHEGAFEHWPPQAHGPAAHATYAHTQPHTATVGLLSAGRAIRPPRGHDRFVCIVRGTVSPQKGRSRHERVLGVRSKLRYTRRRAAARRCQERHALLTHAKLGKGQSNGQHGHDAPRRRRIAPTLTRSLGGAGGSPAGACSMKMRSIGAASTRRAARSAACLGLRSERRAERRSSATFPLASCHGHDA